MWEAVDKMREFGMPLSTYTYTLIISRYLSNENLELALQFLFDMNARGLVPELKAVQGVILLAARLGYPRLALDLATSFEEDSSRRLGPEVWMNCLMSSAQDLYVSIHPWSQCLYSKRPGRRSMVLLKAGIWQSSSTSCRTKGLASMFCILLLDMAYRILQWTSFGSSRLWERQGRSTTSQPSSRPSVVLVTSKEHF